MSKARPTARLGVKAKVKDLYSKAKDLAFEAKAKDFTFEVKAKAIVSRPRDRGLIT